jgi:hypothetical protein
MPAEESASPTQNPSHNDSREQRDVLRIIADVERSLGALRARADTDRATSAEQRLLLEEVERLKSECTRLTEERSQIREKSLRLENELAAAESTRVMAEERARRAEEARIRIELEAANTQFNKETDLVKSLEGRIAAERNRADELEKQWNETRQELAIAMSKLTAVLKVAEKHALHANELEATVEALRAEVETARKLQREAVNGSGDVPLAEEHINQTIVPRLSQVAGFLKVRKDRLVNVHRALKRRMQAMRMLRQLYSAQPAILAAEAEAISKQRASLEAERAELAAEKAEVVALHEKATRSLQLFAQLTGISRALALGSLATALLAGAAWLSWMAAAAIAPKDAVATVELQTTTRGADSAAANSEPIAVWLKTMTSNPAFLGTVAGRLADRGYAREEADTLVAPIAEYLHIDDTGSGLVLTMRGRGVEQTVALLDAFTAVAISESAKQPERDADQIRLTVLAAKQEVGRTVVARGMLMKDETHLARAGLIFAMCATLGGGVVAFSTMTARKAGRRASDHPSVDVANAPGKKAAPAKA